MYGALLIAHLMGAALTGVQGIASVVALIRGSVVVTYHRQAKVLSTLGMVTIATGAMLSIVSSKISAASLCDNVAIYLGTLAVVEALLYFKIKSLQQPFPLGATLSRLAIGTAPFVFALAIGM
jgi:hypothetical protein